MIVGLGGDSESPFSLHDPTSRLGHNSLGPAWVSRRGLGRVVHGPRNCVIECWLLGEEEGEWPEYIVVRGLGIRLLNTGLKVPFVLR